MQKRLDPITQSLIDAVDLRLDHPKFYPLIIDEINRLNKSKPLQEDPITQIVAEDYHELSNLVDISGIQESTSVRNTLRSRAIAKLLIDEKGELKTSLISPLISQLESKLYSLAPQHHYDAKRNEQILRVLKTLLQNKEIPRIIKRITKPLGQKNSEEFIRETLQIPSTIPITDANTRQAVLCAWLTTLRQNVGSCFATAPAEIIHDEQPEQFLLDLTDLLASGQLKRTYEGIEYLIPLSASWGNGDLKKPIIIRRQYESIDPPLWLSPALLSSLEAVDIINKDSSYDEKISKLKNIVLNNFLSDRPYEVITIESLLRRILLEELQLTEKNIEDYLNRPQDKFQMQLLTPSIPKPRGTLSDRCSTFLIQLSISKNIFKSYTENALLKAWEFTLASYSETKLEFTKWNLYYSLGFATQEPGGIGECIYNHIKHKLDIANRQLESTQAEYEAVYHYIKSTESRIRQASTEEELSWLKIEYQGRLNEFQSLEMMRDRSQAIAKGLVNLHNALHTIYLDLFKIYFQEVYDADTQEVVKGQFDDCPAGFRLLYKHGRSNTSQWTYIRSPGEFIDALTNFFSITEPQVIATLDHGNIEREISEVITAIIHHIKTKRFLESAFDRMAAAYRVPAVKDPLNHLDKIEKKPWAYTSGGTMNNLVQTYYRLPDKPRDEGRWVESEVELLVFLVDNMKQIPPHVLKPYLENRRQAMLMQSPTHAFLLKPNGELFKSAYLNDTFTYTYLRDELFKPMEQFIDQMTLDDDMIHYLVDKLADKVHENYRPRFKEMFRYLSGPMNPVLFRSQIASSMDLDRGFKSIGRSLLPLDQIDNFLFSNLPLMSSGDVRSNLKSMVAILESLSKEEREQIIHIYDEIGLTRGEPIINADQFQKICLSLIALVKKEISSNLDYPLLVSRAAQKLGLSMPTPIFFADTNWVKDEFAFVINPGTGTLDLWRIDYLGRNGFPMSMWKEWLDGSRQDQKWVVYIQPYQYGQF